MIPPAPAIMGIATPLLHNNALESPMPMSACVLHADRMPVLQSSVIIGTAAIIDKRHVAAVAVACALIVAEAKANGVAAIALVETILMVCVCRRRQDGSDGCQDEY